jgi:hypothetical protein
MRIAMIVVFEVVTLVALLVFVATVAIPFASPPPNRPTPTAPTGALLDCPRSVPGCR